MTAIAVLGTGIMGAPIAANLAGAGCDVGVWNRTREKAEAIDRVIVSGTPAEAAAGVDIVITMLSDAVFVPARRADRAARRDFASGHTFMRYFWQLELDDELQPTGRHIVADGPRAPRE